jgi:hypothetical protein
MRTCLQFRSTIDSPTSSLELIVWWAYCLRSRGWNRLWLCDAGAATGRKESKLAGVVVSDNVTDARESAGERGRGVNPATGALQPSTAQEWPAYRDMKCM